MAVSSIARYESVEFFVQSIPPLPPNFPRARYAYPGNRYRMSRELTRISEFPGAASAKYYDPDRLPSNNIIFCEKRERGETPDIRWRKFSLGVVVKL